MPKKRGISINKLEALIERIVDAKFEGWLNKSSALSKMDFAEQLYRSRFMVSADDSSFPRRSGELMLSFLKFGSDTPDNVNCYQHIEFGVAHEANDAHQVRTAGLKVRGKAIFVSDVLNILEGIEPPDAVKEAYPDLTSSEWEAVMRMATMVAIAFEVREVTPK